MTKKKTLGQLRQLQDHSRTTQGQLKDKSKTTRGQPKDNSWTTHGLFKNKVNTVKRGK